VAARPGCLPKANRYTEFTYFTSLFFTLLILHCTNVHIISQHVLPRRGVAYNVLLLFLLFIGTARIVCGEG